MFQNRAWLGQVPLVPPPSYPEVYDPKGTPPYWGQWGVVDQETGKYIDSGEVGPFDTSDEAFNAAAEAASQHGARKMPLDGFAQVKDSAGQAVGPII